VKRPTADSRAAIGGDAQRSDTQEPNHAEEHSDGTRRSAWHLYTAGRNARPHRTAGKAPRLRDPPALRRLRLVVALVTPHDVDVYGAFFAVLRGNGDCLRLATLVAKNGRHEAGCDLTNGAIGIRI
jgi:hypothetical protein